MWGSEIGAWTDRLIAAWNRGDMEKFRALGERIDEVWSDEVLNEHGEDLFNVLGKAMVAEIEKTERALAQLALGFGPTSTEALPFVQGRRAVAALLDSAGWKDVPYQLRDRAFFAARVNDLQTLTEMRRRIEQALDWQPDFSGDGSKIPDAGPVMDAGRFEKEMRRILINGGVRTARPEELGTVKDIMSAPRLQLVYKTQTDMARGWAALKTGMDPDILNAVPGYLFTRLAAKRNPRGEAFWQGRWDAARAASGGVGSLARPMIALKTSPVWQALGSLGPFGNPYEPFDWGSGMGREDADRDLCVEHGLIREEEELKPSRVPDLDERMEEGVEGLDARATERLLDVFGDKVEISGGRAKWRA